MALSSLFQKIAQTFALEGGATVLRKAGRRARYFGMRMKQQHVPYEYRWQGLKDRYKGQRVFLLGNGPSLNKTPLHLLRNEYTLCCNRFSIMYERLAWRPTFYLAVDDLVLDDLVDDVPQLIDSASFFFFPDIHFRGKRYDDKIKHSDKIYWLKTMSGRGFSSDLPAVHVGGSVIYEGLQILNYLGFSEIILLGVDMSFNIHQTAEPLGGDRVSIRSKADDDPNHFDPRYFGTNRRYHQPEPHVVRFIVDSLEYAARVAREQGIYIRNAGVDSQLDCFERVTLSSLFDISQEDEERLFNEVLAQVSRYSDWSHMVESVPEVGSNSSGSHVAGDFTAVLSVAVDIIPQAIFTHVPLGPYAGRYFFIERDSVLAGS